MSPDGRLILEATSCPFCQLRTELTAALSDLPLYRIDSGWGVLRLYEKQNGTEQ